MLKVNFLHICENAIVEQGSGNLSIIGIFATLELVKAAYREATDPVFNQTLNQLVRSDRRLNYETKANFAIAIPLIYSALLTFVEMIALNNLLAIPIRIQESNADKFAYKLCDMNALNGGVAFFEDEKIDPLFDIANKQFSPFVETDSTFGSVCQALTMCVDVPCFYIDKTIKRLYASTDITRWYYDYCRDAHHPGPSTRAYAIRKEIEARLQS